MTGKTYTLDDWLNLVSQRKPETMSDGAKWWLNRIKEKTSIV